MMKEKEIVELSSYYNTLDINAFSNSFKKTVACYKMYWLDAIITIFHDSRECSKLISFNELFDEMIYQGWYSRAYYKLRLGNRIGGHDTPDALQGAIDKLLDVSGISPDSSEEIVRNAIKEYAPDLQTFKNQLKRYVPIKYLQPFTHSGNDNYSIMEPVIDSLFMEGMVPYRIVNSKREKYIEIHREWACFFMNEFFMLKKWIEYEKCSFLQKYNQEVPGIINKLTYDSAERDLSKLRELWNTIIPSGSVRDIFSNNIINVDNYELDHFIPWSYIANNELWNICPIDPLINNKKSDFLPPWEYAESLGECQYELYKHITTCKSEKTIQLFKQCKDKHLCAEWANILLYKNVEKAEFISEIIEHVKIYYQSALNLGYQIWDYPSTEYNYIQ